LWEGGIVCAKEGTTVKSKTPKGARGSVKLDAVILRQAAEDLSLAWRPTTLMRAKDEEESARVANRIRARLKECYWNARRVITKLADYKEASYVEGMAVSSLGFPLEHAWVIRGGLVIDPTDVLRPNAPMIAYFAGLQFKGRTGIAEFLSRFGLKYRRHPFFFAFGWGGAFSKSFTASREAAMAHAYGPGRREHVEKVRKRPGLKKARKRPRGGQ
jgi:hypothetical protein